MAKVIVTHQYYGCDTGCCGHVVKIDGEAVGQFDFDHPWDTKVKLDDAAREFIRKLVTEQAGAEHVKDIDWENCIVTSD